jgi:hypothetical protein
MTSSLEWNALGSPAIQQLRCRRDQHHSSPIGGACARNKKIHKGGQLYLKNDFDWSGFSSQDFWPGKLQAREERQPLRKIAQKMQNFLKLSVVAGK